MKIDKLCSFPQSPAKIIKSTASSKQRMMCRPGIIIKAQTHTHTDDSILFERKINLLKKIADDRGNYSDLICL